MNIFTITSVKYDSLTQNRDLAVGSGYGSVGGAVISTSRGPQFEYSHWQKFIL